MPGAPRTDPYVKDYFIRLLPWVCDGKAHGRIRMEDLRLGDPAPRQTVKPLPGPDPAFLASPAKHAKPEAFHLGAEFIKAVDVAGDRVVVEPPADHRL